MSRRIQQSVGLCALVAVISSAACGGSNQPGAPAAPAPAAAPTDTADGPGVISGTTLFEGTVPPARPLRTDSDPLCKPEPGATSEVLVVGPGNGLQNVFVHVKDGLGTRTYAIPTTPVVMDQKGCRYIPHVFGVRVGQTLRITNSDSALHNVNATPTANSGFNLGQPTGVPAATKTFDKPEIMIPFRCDVHTWMNAHAGVVPHPFFAVSTADGRFEIKGLPAGTFTIEAWHERLGTQTQSVTVDAAKPAAAVTFAFSAKS